MAGKGDKYRPVNLKRYNENYEYIFGKQQDKIKKIKCRKKLKKSS